MSRILAIETSGQACSVALLIEGLVAYEASSKMENSHSIMLGHLMQSALRYCNLSAEDLDAAGVGSGPGSYTGIRVGMATIKGFCMPGSMPVVGVGTLENIAFQAFRMYPEVKQVAAAIEARKSEVFVGVFDAGLKPVKAPTLLNLKETNLSDWLETRPYCLAGPGSEVLLQHLKSTSGFFLAKPILPTAEAVAFIAESQIKAGYPSDIRKLEARYLKEVYFSPSKK